MVLRLHQSIIYIYLKIQSYFYLLSDGTGVTSCLSRDVVGLPVAGVPVAGIGVSAAKTSLRQYNSCVNLPLLK